MKRRYTTLPLLAWLCVATTAGAQESGPLCWSAHPQPRCGAFLLTNAGLYTQIGQSSPSAVFEGGFMVNVSRRDAVGASLLATIADNNVAGVAVHYRRWLGKDASLEAAVGVPTDGQSGVFGALKYNPVNWLGLVLRPRFVQYSYATRPRFDASLGFELSGTPAVASTALAFVVFLATFGLSRNYD